MHHTQEIDVIFNVLFSFEWQIIFFNISKGEGNPRCVEDFGGTFSEEEGESHRR